MLYDSKDLFSGSVVLCPMCKGYGRILKAVGDYEYNFRWATCPLCQGDKVVVVQLERIEKDSGK